MSENSKSKSCLTRFYTEIKYIYYIILFIFSMINLVEQNVTWVKFDYKTSLLF